MRVWGYGGVDVDVESGETEDKSLPDPWDCLARSVYPALINHACLLDAEFERNKTPIDDVMELPTRLDALLDAEESDKVERMDGYNAKRHERMVWGPPLSPSAVFHGSICTYERY